MNQDLGKRANVLGRWHLFCRLHDLGNKECDDHRSITRFCGDATGIDGVAWEKFGADQIFLGIEEGDHGVGFDRNKCYRVGDRSPH